MLTNSSARDITCTILPGKLGPHSPVPPLYNEAYRYWKRTWGEIFLAAGSPQSLDAANFLRQDLIITLHERERVAGILASTLFSLSAEACLDHPYFVPFFKTPSEQIASLRNRPEGLVLTAEYLSVQPEFRRSALGVSLSEVLIGLLVQVFRDLDGRMMLGTYEKYGLDCVLMCNTPEQWREHEDPAIVSLVQRCWQGRQDLTGITRAAHVPGWADVGKKAA